MQVGGDFSELVQAAFIVNIFCVCCQTILLSLYYSHILMSHKETWHSEYSSELLVSFKSTTVYVGLCTADFCE